MKTTSSNTCKICRRLGQSVCGREKCAFKRKPYPPGIHGKAFRRGLSEYGLQLRDKQRVKFLYGLRERQFKKYILSSVAQKTIPTGEAIIRSLEMRLDNVVYRLGIASTRKAARQIVGHGHIAVNSKSVSASSYKVKVGDEIKIKERSAQKNLFANLPTVLKKYSPPEWLALDKDSFAGKIVSHPPIDEFNKTYNISSIVEYYSR